MALPIDVSSIDVLRSVREALLLFREDGKNALGQMEMEIRHCVDWLTNEQRIHWQTEIKKRKEKLSEAKAELSRKQLGGMPGSQPHDSEQRENVRMAKIRLEEAEDKLETVRRWVPNLERAVSEYDGPSHTFADMLDFDVIRSAEMVERMIEALEDYVRIAPPETSAGRSPLGAASSSGPTLVTSSAAPSAPAAVAAETAGSPTPAATPPQEENVAPAAATVPTPAEER